MAGETNFVAALEGRLNSIRARQEYAEESAASEFARLVGAFADVMPQGYSRVQQRVEEGTRAAALLTRINQC